MNLRIVVAGAGAIARNHYLPALRRRKDVEIRLVDRSEDTLAATASQFDISDCSTDLETALQDSHGLIVATPPVSHFPMIQAGLDAGLPVIAEKPLVIKGTDLTSLLSHENAASVSVNNTRRLFPSFMSIRQLLQSGSLGRVISYAHAEGGKYNWPTASGFYFDHRVNQMGVTQDRGSHAVDLARFLIDDPLVFNTYEDDSLGGPEATSRLQAVSSRASVPCSFHFSHLNKTRNLIEIRCENGTIQADVYDWRQYAVIRGTRSQSVSCGNAVKSFAEFANPLVNNLIEMIQSKVAPLISMQDVENSIRLLEEIYANRRTFPMAWIAREAQP